MSTSIQLEIFDGPDRGSEFVFDGKRMVVGRGSKSDLVLRDHSCSREHLAIEQFAGDWVLVDLESNNGTFVRGQGSRVRRHVLQSGDEITLGRTKIRITLRASPTAAVSTPADPDATRAIRPPAPPPRSDAEPTVDAPQLEAEEPSDLPIVLTVLDGPDRGMVYSPNDAAIRIGRRSSCDVPLTDDQASRVHATIKREAAGYRIYDEGTRNGTWLGSPLKRVHQANLSDGDRIRIGVTHLRVNIGVGKQGGPAREPREGTMVMGAIGERTFTMSLQSLLAHRSSTEAEAPAANEAVDVAPSLPEVKLRVIAGPGEGAVIDPGLGDRFTVGRSAKADAQIGDPGISGTHFAILRQGGTVLVADAGSRNGTFLGRPPTRVESPTPLVDGAIIRVAESEVEVRIRSLALPAERVATPAPELAEAAVHAVPEVERAAEAKDRISRIMKGVSLRPVRSAGTPRQWASAAMVLLAGLLSLGLSTQWPSFIAAGPLSEPHADLDVETGCANCHVDSGFTHATEIQMSGACASCHVDSLAMRAGVEDNCVACHSEHRGRSFALRGDAEDCWVCHENRESPRDFQLRPMRAVVELGVPYAGQALPGLRPYETGLRYSHRAHDEFTVGDAAYDDCVGCHQPIEAGRSFSTPGHAACWSCHEDSLGNEDAQLAEASESCTLCHLQNDGRMAPAPEARFAYVEFSHQDHADGQKCQSCHGEVWATPDFAPVVRSADVYPVSMNACVTCHEDSGATLACLDCHREHHSFPDPPEVGGAPGRERGFQAFAAGIVFLSLLGFGYVWADARVVRRYQALAKAGPSAAFATTTPGEGPAAEVLPFPTVDVEACISCGGCYQSCPKQVLAGDDHGKSTVVAPDSCISQEGCNVCEQGCPTGAIRVTTAPLIRTVERPDIDENLEAKPVPGLFFVGEVIGAALIKSAVNQGTDVVRRVQEHKPRATEGAYDVIIVGAGPGGLAAGLEAKHLGLKHLVLERDTIASTIRGYPRDKAVLAEPIKVPLYGKLPMMDAEKDELISVWMTVVQSTGLEVSQHEPVAGVRREGDLLVVTTSKGEYRAVSVVLAIGTRGNPRRLGADGETSARVAYSLIDAAEWRGRSVLVVGGGDSAIEAAVALSKEEGTTARLSYRKSEFQRVKKRNLEQLEAQAAAGRLQILLDTEVEAVTETGVRLKGKGAIPEFPCDQVFALIGADPPKRWIEGLGVPFVETQEEVVTWS